MKPSIRVAIVGGGPVGLLLGLALSAKGISFHIYERRHHREAYSRAIGIHPSSLHAFRQLGVEGTFLAEGVHVSSGLAFAGTKPLGTLDFSTLPGRFRFVLTLPQARSEAILEAELLRRAPACLTRGLLIEDVSCLDADYVVACDGWQSGIREAAGIGFPGGAYPDTFLMGDFADHTGLGPRAGIYLCREGLVESFPLPKGLRRYVAATQSFIQVPAVEDLVRRITRRIGELPDAGSNSLLSSFRVHHHLADQFLAGRILLCGDAAHALTPIGGLGMNLGWLDAMSLADALAEPPERREAALKAYARSRRNTAARAIRASAMNMRLARPGYTLPLRQWLVARLLNSTLAPRFARRCAMM